MEASHEELKELARDLLKNLKFDDFKTVAEARGYVLKPGEEKDSLRKDDQKKDLVNLSNLLNEISSFLKRYVVFTDETQSCAVTLWIAHTYAYNQFPQSPYLFISSPDKRCGKTRLLEVIELLVHKPWRIVSPSEAVVFRKIESDAPTILLDEVDTVFNKKSGGDYEGLRAILNTGNRPGTSVSRCLEKGNKLKDFSIFCPKALAGIGTLPDTVADRCIIVSLTRKKKEEKIEKFRYREASRTAEPLRKELERWAEGVDFTDASPEMPEGLNDRAEDNWEALLAIAEAASEEWARRARAAAVKLSGSCVKVDDDSLGVILLSDIKKIFDEKEAINLTSEELIEELVKVDESPWAEFNRGRQLTPQGLARLLGHFAIKPQRYFFGKERKRGYKREDFVDAWERFCPSFPSYSITSVQSVHAGQSHTENGVKIEKIAEKQPLNCVDTCGQIISVHKDKKTEKNSLRTAWTPGHIETPSGGYKKEDTVEKIYEEKTEHEEDKPKDVEQIVEDLIKEFNGTLIDEPLF